MAYFLKKLIPMGIKSLGNQIPWELKILANG